MHFFTTLFRYAETFAGPIVKPQIPMMFGLVNDPCEARDLFALRGDCAWMLDPVFERLGAFQRRPLPNIKLGQEFTGY